MPTLVLSPRQTPDAQALWQSVMPDPFWQTRRMLSIQVPEHFIDDLEEPVLYGEALFCDLWAEALGIILLDPHPDWLPYIPHECLKRTVRAGHLEDLDELFPEEGPAFVKPAQDKVFPAKVHESPGSVRDQLDPEINPKTMVLVSEVVEFAAEVRIYVLNGKVAGAAPYVAPAPDPGHDFVGEAVQFFTDKVPTDDLPPGVVVDVGFIPNRGWAVVEANPAYSAGVYKSDLAPEILRVVQASQVQTTWHKLDSDLKRFAR